MLNGYMWLCRRMCDKIKEEKGLGTIEIVVILGILLGIALLFRETVTKFVTELMAEFFNADKFK